MKKIFTLAAALMASFSLMAAEPNYGSYDWGESDFATVFANHDGIVLSSDVSAWKGNLSGKQYVALGGGTDLSADAPNPYFGITADAPIDSIEVFWAPNGTNNTSVAWAGWENASELLNQTVVAMGKTETYKATKSYDDAIWQKIDLSGYDFKAVMLARQIKKAIINGQQQSNLGDNQTVNILGVRVWLHETKTVVSTEESLTAVTINDVAISATDLASLVSNKYLFLADAYVTAPVVKFTKHIVITYDDQTTKESDEVIEVTSQPATTTWGASATINGNSYYVYTSKAASRTVTYMYGEQVLGTEIVAANGNPAEYAQYETMPLATFNGWFKDAELTQKVESMAAEVISADVTFYAKFSKAYAESIDFEGMVINNGKSYDVKSALDAKYYDYKTIDALDSLNDAKGVARNEPYLGLKIKKQGGYIACNVLPGTTLRIKFGYVGDPVLAIAGSDTLPLTPTDNKLAELTVPFMIEKLVKLQTTSDKTVVIKQIKVDEPIATWMYPITYAPAENGKVEGWTIAFPGEDVTVAIAPEAGYLTHSLTYNGVALHDDENTGAATFTMPAEAVSVEASFVSEYPTDINNTDAAVKAVKVIRNGQLIIVREGIEYNAQGAIVK